MTAATADIQPAYRPRTRIYGVAAVAMIAVIIEHLRVHRLAAHGHKMAGIDDMPAPGLQFATTPSATVWVWWVIMAAAMMLPLAAVEADRIAAGSLWQRRHVAVIEYLAAYLSVWSVFGLAALWLVALVWPDGVPAVGPALAVLAAAVWQVTPPRRRALRRCGRPAYLHVRGWHADRDCLMGGLAFGRRCLITCAPVMAAMTLAHSILVMLATTILLLTERARGPNPGRRAGRPFEAVALTGLAIGLAAWAVTGRGELP